jgi:hypothetical protein
MRFDSDMMRRHHGMERGVTIQPGAVQVIQEGTVVGLFSGSIYDGMAHQAQRGPPPGPLPEPPFWLHVVKLFLSESVDVTTQSSRFPDPRRRPAALFAHSCRRAYRQSRTAMVRCPCRVQRNCPRGRYICAYIAVRRESD